MATNSSDERAARKQYVRKKQTIVFGIVGVILAVAMLISLLFFFHVNGLGVAKNSTEEANYGVVAPCAQQDENKAAPKYPENRTITIRVLNGTQFSGLAQAVGQALEKREFVLQEVGNYSGSDVERTTIQFGAKGINQAYTVARNFPDAVLKMDNRDDELVDVIVGATFNDLVEEEDVPKTGSEIENITGCKPADQMTKLPQAPEHTPVG